MKKGRYQSPKANSPNWIVILLLLLILLIGILIFILLRPKQMEVSTPNGMSYIDTGPVEKNQGSISIPGYESITLTAGEKKQTVGLPNPAKNSCSSSPWVENSTMSVSPSLGVSQIWTDSGTVPGVKTRSSFRAPAPLPKVTVTRTGG